MGPFRSALKQYSYLPVTLYSIALIGYGLWFGAQHIHWAVPFILVGFSVLAGPALNSLLPSVLVSLVAVGLSVEGLALALGVFWYVAAVAVILGLLACVMLAVGASKISAPNQVPPAEEAQ